MGLDIHLTDTYFVVAHFHYIMVGGAIMAYMGGLHFWWPKMTGKLYSEGWAQGVGDPRVRRLQPDVLPAVRARLPGHAAPLSRVSGGVPGAERAVDGRRVRSSRSATCCRRLLPHLLALQGRAGAGQSVGREGPRVDDPVAAADVQLRRGPGRDRAGLQLQAGDGRCTLASPRLRSGQPGARRTAVTGMCRRRTAHGGHDHAHHPKLQHHFYSMEQQLEASTLGMWVFLVTEIMFFGGLFMAYIVYRTTYPDAWVGRQQPPERAARRAQHRRADLSAR